jgi:hypothetical protein
MGPLFRWQFHLVSPFIYFLYQRIKSALWAFLYRYNLSLCYLFFLRKFLRPCPLTTSQIKKIYKLKRLMPCWNFRECFISLLSVVHHLQKRRVIFSRASKKRSFNFFTWFLYRYRWLEHRMVN